MPQVSMPSIMNSGPLGMLMYGHGSSTPSQVGSSGGPSSAHKLLPPQILNQQHHGVPAITPPSMHGQQSSQVPSLNKPQSPFHPSAGNNNMPGSGMFPPSAPSPHQLSAVVAAAAAAVASSHGPPNNCKHFNSFINLSQCLEICLI